MAEQVSKKGSVCENESIKITKTRDRVGEPDWRLYDLSNKLTKQEIKKDGGKVCYTPRT